MVEILALLLGLILAGYAGLLAIGLVFVGAIGLVAGFAEGDLKLIGWSLLSLVSIGGYILWP
jgi:hypothetical protein